MPTFCRHGRFIERCPICRETLPGPPTRSAARPRAGGAAARAPRRAGGAGLRVRRESRPVDDGYSSALVPGLRSSADAERLAIELALSAARLELLETSPPGAYAEAAAEPDRELGLALCFLAAYLCPLEGADPWSSIRAAFEQWRRGELPDLAGLELGPRSSHAPARGDATLLAYRQWAERSGSQLAAFSGDQEWSPQRRFERVYERLALPGFGRSGRFELLLTVGRLGLAAPLRAGALLLSPEDGTVVAAKRVFGIGDRHNLERRAAALAAGCGLDIEALDLALWNWGAQPAQRAHVGVPADVINVAALERVRAALGLPESPAAEQTMV